MVVIKPIQVNKPPHHPHATKNAKTWKILLKQQQSNLREQKFEFWIFMKRPKNLFWNDGILTDQRKDSQVLRLMFRLQNFNWLCTTHIKKIQ